MTAGRFHDFHGAWINCIRQFLNDGLLPSGYDALGEQVASMGRERVAPDVFPLQGTSDGSGLPDDHDDDEGGSLAIAVAPPRLKVHTRAPEVAMLAFRRRRVVVRHATGDRVVAHLEIVSHGNRDRREAVDQFVDKATDALYDGIHLQLIDLFPPGPFEPRGMHAAVWAECGGTYDPPAGQPLTVASYVADGAVDCYAEPTAVGDALVDVPLSLTPGRYVNVPLEAPYAAAYAGMPRQIKRVTEAA